MGPRKACIGEFFAPGYRNGAVGPRAGEATTFGDRDMGWMLSIDGIWEDAADDEKNLAWARAFWADMKHQSNGRAYLNFTGFVALKTKYDPTNLFRLNQNNRSAATSKQAAF